MTPRPTFALFSEAITPPAGASAATTASRAVSGAARREHLAFLAWLLVQYEIISMVLPNKGIRRRLPTVTAGLLTVEKELAAATSKEVPPTVKECLASLTIASSSGAGARRG